MRSPFERLSAEVITAAIRDRWGLRIQEFRYLPEGGGAYHWSLSTSDGRWFVTCDDLDTKPWLGVGRDTVFTGLIAAYRTAMDLAASGRKFVVASRRDSNSPRTKR